MSERIVVLIEQGAALTAPGLTAGDVLPDRRGSHSGMPNSLRAPALHWGHWLAGLLLAVLLTLVPVVQAADLIRSRAVFEDPGGQLTLAQVVDQPFAEMGSLLSRGFSTSVFWIRIDVNPGEDDQPVRLRIVPTLLDEVRLYEPDPDAAHGWRLRVGGDLYSFEQGDRTIQSLGFLIHPRSPFTTYYLRIHTTASVLASVEALSPGESMRMDAYIVLVQIVYLSFMAWVLVWAIRSYWQRHDRVTGFFIGYQFVSLLLSLALTGHLAPFEPAGSSGVANQLTSLIIFLNGIFAVLFHREVFALFAPNRILMRALKPLAAVFTVCLLAYLAGWQHPALYANSLALFVFGILLCWLALTARQRDPLSLRMLRAAYVLLSLSLIAALLPSLGWLGGDRRILMGIMVHGFLSAGVMLYLLSQRARRLAAEANEKLRQGELAMQQLDLEKQYANEQERFFDMLTHELKTPISVALMSLGALKSDSPYLVRIRRALGNINDIVDQTRLVELARQKRLPTHLSTINASERVYECIEASTDPDRVKACVGFGLELVTDSQLFGIIVANLIDNALKYSPPGEPVELGFHPHEEQGRSGALLSVSNRVGPAGTPDPSRVFARYYRSAGAYNKTGSGLGLNLCQHLAMIIGARLSYRARHDKVEFELWLPA